MHFISEVYWNKGGREVNQDSVSLQEVIVKGKRVLFGLICDGIGGLYSGELASGFAAECMTEWFHKEALFLMGKNKRKKKLIHAGLRALFACNERMLDYAKEKQISFGTTLTMIIVYRNRYILWHSGDSRAYRIYGRRRRKIERLTKDHTLGANVLTKCIGSFRWKQPDVSFGRVKSNTTFLICSDGFRHIINEERIKETLAPEEIKDSRQLLSRMTEIAEYSIKKGERDNISAITFKVE